MGFGGRWVTTTNLAGLLLACLNLVLPGYAWILISGLFRRLRWPERFALSFILSVSFISLITPALSLVTAHYLLYSEALCLELSVVLIGYCLYRKPSLVGIRISFRIEKKWTPLVIALVGYVMLLSLLYWGSPYFPTAGASDAIFHAEVSQAILSGDGRNIVLHTSSSPIGLQFVAALISDTAGINVLDSLRLLLSLVLIDIVLLTYFAAKVVFGNGQLAGIAVLVGAFAMPADLIHFILVGTFLNIVVDAIVLSLLWLLFSYVKAPERAVGLTLTILGLGGVVMHSSIFLFFASLWVLIPIVFLVARSQFRRYISGASYSISGMILLVVVAFSVLGRNVQRIFESYTMLLGATPPQSQVVFLLAYFNLVSNFRALMGWATAIATALALIFVLAKPRKSITQTFLVVWFAVLVVGALVSAVTDRFVLFSMIPATFLVASLLGWGYEALATYSRTHINSRKIRTVAIALVLLVLVANGEFPRLALIASDPATRSRQFAVEASMEWLMQKGCPGSVASLGLGTEYRFLFVLTGIPYAGDLLYSTGPDKVFQKSIEMGFSCVAMATGNQNFHSFELDQRFKEKYRNVTVTIFLVLSTPAAGTPGSVSPYDNSMHGMSMSTTDPVKITLDVDA